ncbi:MAG: hypothetical protein Q9162_007798 [Coniocarpon cinnabarinum]
MESQAPFYDVIVAGAGPVGLLIALRLGRAGVKTLVLERHASILPTTRAVVYQPIVIPALRELDVLDLVISNAFLNHEGVSWLDMEGRQLARLSVGTGTRSSTQDQSTDSFNGILLLGQQRLCKLILEELRKCTSVTVRFGASITGLSENRGGTVCITASDVRNSAGPQFKTQWVIGADGANSSVRRLVNIPFEGFTWQHFKMIGADVWQDFSKTRGLKPMNFIVHPHKWAVIIYCGQDKNGDPYGNDTPLWRVAFAVHPDTNEDPEHIQKLSAERIAEYAPGLKAEDVHISRAEPYKMQQRCAAQARKGRVLLAGDALHSNNPIGGLGLTTGIVDAAAYANALVRVVKGCEPESLLTRCADARREAWLNVTNSASIMNVKRLFAEKKEDVRERERYFQSLNTDPNFARQQLGNLRAIGRDMILPGEKGQARI